MARITKALDAPQTERSPGRPNGGHPSRGQEPTGNAGLGLIEWPSRGLLITADPALARAFQRELRRCAECSFSIDVRSNVEEAPQDTSEAYGWVAVDLDGVFAPSEAVRLARGAWPSAYVAVLSCWWSERDTLARDLADIVIHKPLRSPELLAFLRVAFAAPQTNDRRPGVRDGADTTATG